MFVISTSKLALIVTMMASFVNAFAPPALQQRSSLSLTLKATVEDSDIIESGIQNRRELFRSIPGRAAALSAIAGGIVSGSGVDTIIRPPLAAAATPVPDTYGPLKDLVGKWVGNQGFVMIAVPSPGAEPKDRGDFFIKQFPYREEFNIETISDQVLQVGGSIDQISSVLKYTKTVWATPGVGEPGNEQVIHEENGMFFYLPKIVNNPDNGKPINKNDEAPYALGRSAVIPHGNTAMMFGDVVIDKEAGQGPPTIPFVNTLPTSSTIKIFPPFYLDPYLDGLKPLNLKPTAALKDALAKGGKVKNYYQISMSTDKKKAGGIINTNFVNTRADTQRYSADFWIEELENGKMQMQYSEVANIFFHFNKGFILKSEIDWPHVMVNTLTKQ